MAAVARGIPSFALPATQNTAPVHEYRCLYTHDARKKTKKWHDGTARFHTFNKRVMVYDDAKSFVGDLHYRADEEFDEGIELHLDRGVLVEVGERLGETQTDLTGIVHRSHVDNNVSASSISVQARPVQRAVGLNGQGRPKSLTELLGTSQSRYARAKLQHTSPFEQRQALSEAQQPGPPLKRQKTTSGKENDYTIEQVVARPHPVQQLCSLSNGYTSPATYRPQVQQLTVKQSTAAPPSTDQCVIDISSDEDMESTPKPVSRKSRRSEMTGALRHVEDKPCLPKNKTMTTSRSGLTAPRGQNPANQAPESLSRSSMQSALVDSGAPLSSRSKLQMGSLRMVSQKPRQKLMYRALLPSSFVDQTSEPAPAVSEAHNTVGKSPHSRDQNDDLVISSGAEIQNHTSKFDELEDLFSPAKSSLPSHTTPKTHQRSDLSSGPPRQSPLFVSQADSQRSPSPSRAFIEDNFRIPATQEPITIANEHINPDLDEVQESAGPSRPESPCFPQPPSRSREEVQDVFTAMPPSEAPDLPDPAVDRSAPPQRPPSPTRTRIFTRSLSENDPPLPHDPRTTPSHPFLQPVEELPINTDQFLSPLHHPSLGQAPVMHNTTPSKSPLQRSRSDTAVIAPVITAPPLRHASPDEQGPWTKLEAFLLFAEWPACKAKNKPVFEPLLRMDDIDDVMADSDADEDGSDFVLPTSRRPPVLIRSARSVLRDG